MKTIAILAIAAAALASCQQQQPPVEPTNDVTPVEPSKK